MIRKGGRKIVKNNKKQKKSADTYCADCWYCGYSIPIPMDDIYIIKTFAGIYADSSDNSAGKNYLGFL